MTGTVGVGSEALGPWRRCCNGLGSVPGELGLAESGTEVWSTPESGGMIGTSPTGSSGLDFGCCSLCADRIRS
jgi:hypothetical protein